MTKQSIFRKVVQNAAVQLTAVASFVGTSNGQAGNTNNNTSENIMVYPNPTTGDLNFEFPTGSGSVTLMEITGQVLEKQALNNTSSAVFSLSSYAPGLYMYQVTVNGVTKTGKVVLTH